MDRLCEECGEVFEAGRGLARGARALTCSKGCSDARNARVFDKAYNRERWADYYARNRDRLCKKRRERRLVLFVLFVCHHSFIHVALIYTRRGLGCAF